jgi:hypothetical protein
MREGFAEKSGVRSQLRKTSLATASRLSRALTFAFGEGESLK